MVEHASQGPLLLLLGLGGTRRGDGDTSRGDHHNGDAQYKDGLVVPPFPGSLAGMALS